MIHTERLIQKDLKVTKELLVKDIPVSDEQIIESKSIVVIPEELHGNIRNEKKWKRLATVLLVSFALMITKCLHGE